MIDGGWLVVMMPDDPVAATPESDLHRPGSVTPTLQSTMVPGGQAPPALAAAPPVLLAAPGPVVALPGIAVGAGVGDVMPVVAEGLLMPPLGAALGLDPPPGLEVLLPDVWALAAADKTSSDTVRRGRILETVMAGSHI